MDWTFISRSKLAESLFKGKNGLNLYFQVDKHAERLVKGKNGLDLKLQEKR